MTLQSLWSLICGFLLSYACTLHASDWQLDQEQDGIRIFHRQNDQQEHEILAMMTVQASPRSLLSVLEQTDNCQRWLYRCEKIELMPLPALPIIADKSQYRLVHTYFNSPWPFADRDMITLSEQKSDYNGLSITIVDKGNDYPLVRGYVRMEQVTGQWLATRMTNGQLQISYQGTGQAGGLMPNWVTQRILVESTLATFIAMRTLLQQANPAAE